MRDKCYVCGFTDPHYPLSAGACRECVGKLAGRTCTVRDKQTMYGLLAAGAFGNTIEQYFSLAEWTPHAHEYPTWGVRSMRAGGDRALQLNVPTAEVPAAVARLDGRANISPMIDRYAVLRGEVMECPVSPFGWHLTYVDPSADLSVCSPRNVWREAFQRFSVHTHGIRALMVLEQFLWPADMDDLRDTLATYSGHVLEFSACNRAVGVREFRNTVVWEVRAY